MAMPIIPRPVRGRLYFQTADVLFPIFVQSGRAWTAADADRVDIVQPLQQQPPAPLRCCDDCQLHFGRDVLRAVGVCPRWGKPRHGVETRCPAFVAKDGAR